MVCEGIVYIGVTLDGYIAHKDGNIDYLMAETTFHPNLTEDQKKEDGDMGFQAFIDSIDIIIMGSGTLKAIPLEYPWAYGKTPVIVLSNSMKELPAGGDLEGTNMKIW
eukprot:Awhi_evm2s705